MKLWNACFVLVMVWVWGLAPAWAAPEVKLWFPSDTKAEVAQKIADGLSLKSGMKIVPRIAKDYPEILSALSEKRPNLAYVGSMVSTIIWSRRLGNPIFQAVDGRQSYAGEMLFPTGQSPQAILHDTPTEVAYTVGASAGEVSAKAATGRKAAIMVASHDEAAGAVKAGRAKAAFVKDSWWEDNKQRFPGLEAYRVPEISESKNPDNILIASKSVTPEVKSLIAGSAYQAPELFGAEFIVPFDSSSFDFTLALMKKAGIDPLTYTWPKP